MSTYYSFPFVGNNSTITFNSMPVPCTIKQWDPTNSGTTANYFGDCSYKFMLEGRGDNVELPIGIKYKLPDGAILEIDSNGNYKIEDKDAKIYYRANTSREFSPHLNASDLLAQFVKYVGSLGVRQGEVLNLPIELFINWLVIEAAERDKDPIPDDIVPLNNHKVIRFLRKPKCLHCGRFISPIHVKNKFLFCNIDHGSRYVRKINPQLALPLNN